MGYPRRGRFRRSSLRPPRSRRILHLYYGNPASYPPILQGAELLAHSGWSILIIGTSGSSGVKHFEMRDLPNTKTILLEWSERRGRFLFILFCLRAMAAAVRWRPGWIYASDPLASIPALAISVPLKARTIYHEHVPARSNVTRSRIFPVMVRARKTLIARSIATVVPGPWRKADLGPLPPDATVTVAHNAPLLRHVVETSSASAATLALVYVGSIGPDRLPGALLHALNMLPETVTLEIIGYETIGTEGYSARLVALADDLGISDRVRFLGGMSHDDAMVRIRDGHVGLCLFSPPPAEPDHAATASNKPFEYLAAGLPLLVPDVRGWVEVFVAPGYGLACDPNDATSIQRAVLRWLEDPRERVAMGASGRQRVLDEWNYEYQFGPIIDAMERAR